MEPSASTLSMARAGVCPGHAAPGTAHLHEVKSRGLEQEHLG